MPEIALSGVSKTYDPGLFKKKVQAVRKLDLGVEKGEVFGLIGPNGAGKSTTIRLMLGLMRPDSGTVLFRGRPIGGGFRHEIGYLPENPYLYDYLTLRELLQFCGRTSGMSSAQSERRIDELLEKVDMSAAKKRPLRTFSKGMLQRAGICFALLHDPGVVILDEPMSGLDPLGRKLVFDIVMELKGQGKTIFFCSHILSDVERLCDRIGVLVAGRKVSEFSHEDFVEDVTRPIHLVLASLSPTQRDALAGVGVGLLDLGDRFLLSLGPDDVASVTGQLREWGIEVLGTRSERVSLEELFLRTVKEYAA